MTISYPAEPRNDQYHSLGAQALISVPLSDSEAYKRTHIHVSFDAAGDVKQ